MNDPVILKSNRYGIQLHLDDQLPFDELLDAILKKFEESEKFFRDASFAISFEGRTLTEEEENEIVSTINEKTTTHVICIVAEDEIREEILKKKTEAAAAPPEPEEEPFHANEAIVRTESVTADEIVIVDQNLIIYGDILPGATVTSKGSVTVLGRVAGKVWAGSDGNEEAFVFGLTLTPESLRIGAIVMAAEEPEGFFQSFKERKQKALPKVAKIKNGMIVTEVYGLSDG